MKRFGYRHFTKYSWGWDIGLFGWWLVWSTAGEARHLYVSNDATPPCGENFGRTLYYRRS